MEEKTSVCPCEAVRELKRIVERHDRQVNDGNVKFAEIKGDLTYIKDKLDKRERFNAGTISAIVNGCIALLLAAIAARL